MSFLLKLKLEFLVVVLLVIGLIVFGIWIKFQSVNAVKVAGNQAEIMADMSATTARMAQILEDISIGLQLQNYFLCMDLGAGVDQECEELLEGYYRDMDDEEEGLVPDSPF